MGDVVIRIDRNYYKLVAILEEGQTLYFSAGQSIAVEKFDMRIGSTEFDYQVNSRQFRGGIPDSIMTMQQSLDDEFNEGRVKSNLYGLPVSLGNLGQMARQRRIELSYGELKPQVFRSTVTTTPVAWRIWFKRTYYTGAASGRGYRGGKGPNAGPNAVATAGGSARIGTGSEAASPRLGSGEIGPLTNDAGVLRVYTKLGDKYQVFRRPFDDHDAVFRPLTLMDHLTSFVRGRGW